MDLNRLTSMVIRMVMRRGVTMGIDHLARRGQDPQAMSAEERAKAKEARHLAGKARKSARLARRIGRF